MKITLLSTSFEQDADIQIVSFPFVFGRGIAPLKRGVYTQRLFVEHLRHVSRIHATFTLDQGTVYLEDNGSLNGTFVNAVKLSGARVPLATGDIILFADKLEFSVDLEEPSKSTAPGELVLIPENNTSGERISITRIPFTIAQDSRNAEQKELKQQFSSLPDKHVKFFLHEGKIIIAVFRNNAGIIIKDSSVSAGRYYLENNSIIKLAPGLSYRFTDNSGLSSQQKQLQNSMDVPEDSTVYLNEATTFLKVFTPNNSDDEHEDKDANSVKGSGAMLSYFTSLPSYLRKIIILASIMLTIGVSGVVLYLTTDSYQIQKLYAEKKYQACLERLNTFLNKDSNREMQSLAKKVMMHAILPKYKKLLSTKNYQGIREQLSESKTYLTNIPDGETVLDLLAFIARVDHLVNNSKDLHTISDGDKRKKITEINLLWQQKKDVYQPILDEFTQQCPEFRQVVENFYADLNDAREMEIYELAEIRKVEKEIRILIRQKNLDQLHRLILEFHASHPNIRGHEKWLADLEHFRTIFKIAEKKNIFAAAGLIDKISMQTDIFKQLANEYIAHNFPGLDALKTINKAKILWQSGKPQQAISLAEGLVDTKWQAALDVEIARLHSFMQLVNATEQKHSQAQHCADVAEVYKRAQEIDQYYIKLLAPRYDRCRKQSLLNINKYLTRAQELFDSYIRAGAISGKMRMASALSPKFCIQAGRLGHAHTMIQTAQKEAALFNLDLSWQAQQEINRINEEFDSQRDRLQESMVLSPDVIKQKLACFQSE